LGRRQSEANANYPTFQHVKPPTLLFGALSSALIRFRGEMPSDQHDRQAFTLKAQQDVGGRETIQGVCFHLFIVTNDTSAADVDGNCHQLECWCRQIVGFDEWEYRVQAQMHLLQKPIDIP
jgi:hypothetical protein